MAPQPEEAWRASGGRPDARGNETLVESYAEASAQLGAALTDLREERDLARRRLDDLRNALRAAQDILSGKPLEPVLKPVLGRMAGVTGVEQAAFLLAHGAQTLRAGCLYGLAQDPLLQVPAAGRYVLEKAAAEPHLHSSADSLDLGQALEAAERSLSALLAVPIRTPRGLQALAVFYYTADSARPSPEALDHLAEIARALSAALELAATLETVRGAERALEMALAGSASLHGLEHVVTSLVDLRERMGAIRRRPDAPAWFLEEFARLGPSLAAALSSGRSLLAFSRGEIQREPILLEELLGDVSSERVLVKVGRGADTVSGDPALLRVALLALLDHVRGSEGVAEIHVEASGDRVLISVGSPPGSPVPSTSGTGASALGLSLARRIAELHGGTLSTQSVPGVQDWIVLSLLPR